MNGKQKDSIKEALYQNAFAGITAKVSFKAADGRTRRFEKGFTRYSVYFAGEELPNEQTADAVYIYLNEDYWQVLNSAIFRPLDFEYQKGLSAGAPAQPEGIQYPSDVGAFVIALYSQLFLLCIFRFVKAWLRTRTIRAASERAEPPASLARVWQFCTERFGLSRVQLLRSRTMPGPIALGTVYPAVIVPDSLWREPSEELLTAAIGQELAHTPARLPRECSVRTAVHDDCISPGSLLHPMSASAHP